MPNVKEKNNIQNYKLHYPKRTLQHFMCGMSHKMATQLLTVGLAEFEIVDDPASSQVVDQVLPDG